jgi:hypothetical protein
MFSSLHAATNGVLPALLFEPAYVRRFCWQGYLAAGPNASTKLPDSGLEADLSCISSCCVLRRTDRDDRTLQIPEAGLLRPMKNGRKLQDINSCNRLFFKITSSAESMVSIGAASAVLRYSTHHLTLDLPC